MPAAFTLEAVLPDLVDDGSTSDLLNHFLERQVAGESFFVAAEALRIFPRRPASDQEDDAPHFAAVFVPPTLVDSEIEKLDPENQRYSGVFFFSPASQEKFSFWLLSALHPLLAHNFTIKGLLSLRGQEHRPADIALLDLSHAPTEAITEVLEATNGQVIHEGQHEALLKILLLSNVRFMSIHQEILDREVTAASFVNSPAHRFEIPICPVCLHRIDPRRLGLPKIRNHQLCSKFCPPPNLVATRVRDEGACFRQRLLRPWDPPSHCVACEAIRTYWMDQADESCDLFCHNCAMQETLWVCLTCGFLGCGRYSNKHAAAHFVESGHPYCLELSTLRIWEYVSGEFAHRSDLLECPSSFPLIHPWIRKPISQGALPDTPGLPPYQLEEKSPKKATMIGEEYEALLQSALEDQAQHYEGEIARLQAALTAEFVDAESMTAQEKEEVEALRMEIGQLRGEIEGLGRELLVSQAQEAGHRARSQHLLREQQITQELLKKIQQESRREHENGTRQIEELEQQIADLTANQQMRVQFSQDEELLNAQIFGTSGEPSSGKKGKKLRRLFRK